MKIITFDETIKNDIKKTTEWLIENNLLDKEGRIYHSIFFKTEDDAKNALKHLISKDYRDSYIDMIEDENEEYPFWIDFVKIILLNESSMISEINNIMSLLNEYNFDYNNFAVLVDVDENEDGESLFFNPNE
jgi:hypothetical protein